MTCPPKNARLKKLLADAELGKVMFRTSAEGTPTPGGRQRASSP